MSRRSYCWVCHENHVPGRACVNPMKVSALRCGGCGRTFSTVQGLGLHFTWNRRKGVDCAAVASGKAPR